MNPVNNLHFYRYTAMGNDMLVIDPRKISFKLTPQNIQHICDRHFGIGADGICYGPLNDMQPFAMEFYNPDGSQAEKSGNGLRIFARYLYDAHYVTRPKSQIAILGQVCDAHVLDETYQAIKMSMGQATFQSGKIPIIGVLRDVIDEDFELNNQSFKITCVNVGNPHCVIFTEALSIDDVKQLGKQIENHPIFPERTNVQWGQVLDEHTIRIEIWERGAGYTLASGTSSCATACAAIANNLCSSPITVHMPGGIATVEVDEQWHIHLTGSVQSIASGYFSDDFLAALE